jgi:secreted Zn-dependent insulinase-like peptidase
MFKNKYKRVLLVSLVFVLNSCALLHKNSAEDIIKSLNDQRDYRYIQLENGLKVMLISDSSTEFSSASLDIFVGSGSDPLNRQGLAHFLEHMLFLGTEKYPQADEYMTFLKDNGGHHNAYTSLEHTNYFFDVKPEALEAVLDRFAQFFISPLLDEKYVEREKHAVHSEYKAGIKNENRRNLDAIRQVINPKHPFTNFSVGNLDTLSSEKTPIKEDLQRFYQQYYAASNMTLAVLGKEPIEKLEKFVREKFTAIPKGKAADHLIKEPLFLPSYLPKILYIQPEKKLHELSLLFPVPDQTASYKSKPLEVIGHVLGHEGKGSLLAYLKAKGWVESLSSSQALGYSGGSLFSINMSLTEKGREERNAVIEAVFQAIALLQKEGVPKWLFEEIVDIAQLEFDYQEKVTAQSYVLSIANNLHYYPAKEVLSAEALFAEHAPEKLFEMLSYLNQNNVFIVVVDDDFEPENKTAYYNVHYAISDFSAELASALKNISSNEAISYPEKNTFLPKDFSINKNLLQDRPILLVDKPGVHLWHKPVQRFSVPKATTYFSFRKDDVGNVLQQSVLMNVYVELLNDSFMEWIYPAYMAGLSLDLYPQMRGISLKIDGFSDKQDELLEETLRHISKVQFDDKQFERIKASLLKDWGNSEKKPPYIKLMEALQSDMQPMIWPAADEIAVLDNLTLQDLQRFSKDFWQNVDILGMTNGNISASQSKQMMSLVEGFVGSTRELKTSINVLKLPKNNQHRVVVSDHDDAGYLLYWQAQDDSLKTQAQYILLSQALESSFFNALRTEQQLGYVVFASYTPIVFSPGMMFVVQSPTAKVSHIHESVLSFLVQSETELMSVSPDHFTLLQQAVTQELLEKPLSLVDESQSYWFDASMGFTQFDRKQQLAAAINALTIKDWQLFVIQLYKTSWSRMYLLSTLNEAFQGFKNVEHVEVDNKKGFFAY